MSNCFNADAKAKEMTSEAIEKAQAMARKCMNSYYQDFGQDISEAGK